MHPRAAEFAQRAAEVGVDVTVEEFPEGTRTAADAAEAVGCDVAQIASSIAMDAAEHGSANRRPEADDADRLVVVVTSGANRVSERRLADLRGVDPDAVGTADADEIREKLGWSIGGVPPFCHETEVPVYLDETLLEFETVWAAAGTPEAVFPIDPERIVEVADAVPVAVSEG